MRWLLAAEVLVVGAVLCDPLADRICAWYVQRRLRRWQEHLALSLGARR